MKAEDRSEDVAKFHQGPVFLSEREAEDEYCKGKEARFGRKEQF